MYFDLSNKNLGGMGQGNETKLRYKRMYKYFQIQ